MCIMRRQSKSVPKYCKHRASGQAVVTLNGRDHYLGPHGTRASKINYDRLIGEWLVSGRQPLLAESDGLTVVEAIARYWRHAKAHYVKNGRPTGEQHGIRSALRFVRELYGDTPAAEFSPIALKAVRARMVDAGLCRNSVNKQIGRVRRMFRWLGSEQLIPASVSQSLALVDGLRVGRTIARETEPVRPVDDATVDATLAHLPDVVADMVRIQRLTGMRPAEVCMLRPCEVDRTGPVWLFTPATHKTAHHGQSRIICIGPRAQEVLLRYLARDAESYCFRPCDSEAKRRAAANAARLTPLSCGDRPGSNRKRRPKRSPGDQYTVAAYRRAISRACDKSFPAPKKIADDPAKCAAWQSEHRWAPNQLRHSAATDIRRQFGVEAAQHVLGHAKTDMTEIYAEKNLETAARVARAIG
jgi:integrase